MGGGGDGEVETGGGHGGGQDDGGEDPGWSHGASPERARRWMDRGLQLGLGWSQAGDGEASRPARKGLAPVAIVNRNQRAGRTSVVL
jgi:hypothetical protein